MLDRFLSRNSKHVRKSHRSQPSRLGRRISLEVLEDRQLLSFSPWFAMAPAAPAFFSWGRQPIPQPPIGTAATNVNLGLSSGTTVYGEALVATATVSPVLTSTSTPTGKVTFTVDGWKAKTVSVADAAAGVTLPAIDAGSHNIGAFYSGDATFAGSVATAVPETVTQASDTLNLTTNAPANPAYGQPIVLTATLTPTAPGGGTGSGIVQFLDGGTVIAQAFVQSRGPNQGKAVATVSNLSIGGSPHNLTANYLGNTDYAPSATDPTTDPVSITIGQAATTTVVYGRPNPVTVGQSATFTAVVDGNYGTTGPTPWLGCEAYDWMPGQGRAARPDQPTGTVSFVVDGGTPVPVTITANGMAQFSTTFSTPGLHTVTATYGGDANYAGSTSQTFNQNVGGVRSRTQVTVTPKPAPVGQDFTLAVTVGAGRSATSSNTPSGTITLVDPSGTIVLTGSTTASEALTGGQAAFTANFPTAGVYPLTVQYSGDDNFAPSTGTILVRVGSPSPGKSGGWGGIRSAMQYIFANW
jgi:large repetitive protein